MSVSHEVQIKLEFPPEYVPNESSSFNVREKPDK